jgi:hypothetical protein
LVLACGSSPEVAAPLLVVTAGGPGAAVLLLAMDTATSGVTGRAEGGLLLGAHAAPFTALGHVLYVDARNLAVITDREVARDLLESLGLPSAPRRHPLG